MFSAYSVLPKDVLLDEYRRQIDFYREMAADAAEGQGVLDYDTVMEQASKLEDVLRTAEEAVRIGQAHLIDYDADRVINNIYAFAVRSDGKVRCWTEIIGDTYTLTDTLTLSQEVYKNLLHEAIQEKRKQYEEVMGDEEAMESDRQHAAIELNIAEVENNTTVQAEKNGESVGYVMLDGDMVFEIKCTLTDRQSIRIETRNLYTGYFQN